MYTYVCILYAGVLKYECMYVGMDVCIYVSMYVYIYTCMYVCMYVSMYVCMYVCRYVCMYADMFVGYESFKFKCVKQLKKAIFPTQCYVEKFCYLVCKVMSGVHIRSGDTFILSTPP